jgi:hypothetical protein
LGSYCKNFRAPVSTLTQSKLPIHCEKERSAAAISQKGIAADTG